MKRYLWLIPLFIVLVFSLAGCTLQSKLTGANVSSTPPVSSTTLAPNVSQQVKVPASVAGLEGLLESIYNNVNPSVVNIKVLQNTQVIPQITGLPGITPETPQYASALASGFVWDTQGHIVTNNHVVADTNRITVTFYDGTTVEASLVGTDPDSDLAVIKVDVPAAQLQPVTIGDSSQLKVGQMAIAIGNPFGLQNTMTVGFISGLGRLLPATQSLLGSHYSIPDIIQTDAAINPGNSGGVLLNDTGAVIGVTAAIATESGSSAGVGFAIPSAIVQQVVPELISTAHYQHPWLGVSVLSLNPDLAEAMNLDANQRGALVESVITDSPAEKAGLQAGQQQVTINGTQYGVGGDVIIAFNGQTVKSSDDLITLLARYGAVGQTVTLTVLRNGQEMQLQVTLGTRPSS